MLENFKDKQGGMTMKEFTIKSKPETQFRFKDINPVKMLALQTAIDFDDIEKTEKLYSFILENTEVNIAGTWTQVKITGRNVYFPVGFEKEINSMMEICITFLNEVVKPLFQKSRG